MGKRTTAAASCVDLLQIAPLFPRFCYLDSYPNGQFLSAGLGGIQQAHAFFDLEAIVPLSSSFTNWCSTRKDWVGGLLRSRRFISQFYCTLGATEMSDRIEKFVDSMKVKPDDRILEIGCGNGVAATLICSKLVGGRYLAIDRSQKMVDAAAKRNESFVNAGLAQFVKAELESADLGNSKFDKVLAMRVRLFHSEPSQAQELAKRWLAPKGKLFVQYDEPPKK